MRRRTFLNSVFAATALAVTPERELFMGSKLRIAVIGAGSWGKEMLKVVMLDPRVVTIAICDIDRSRLKELESTEIESKIKCETFSDHRQMLRSFRPHVTVIASPDDVRAAHSIDALYLGSHVFTGEAVGRTTEELREVEDVARAMNRKVQVALTLRRDPACVAAVDFLRRGGLGEIDRVEIQCFASGGAAQLTGNGIDWRWDQERSNGILGSEGLHWLDLISWWREGEIPGRISSIGKSPCFAQSRWRESVAINADHQVTVYEFGQLRVNWEHRHIPASEPYKVTCGINFHGRQGNLSYQQGKPWVVKTKTRETLLCTALRGKESGLTDCPLQRTWMEFVSSVRGEQRQPLNLREANASAMLIIHAMDSYRTGCTVLPNFRELT